LTRRAVPLRRSLQVRLLGTSMLIAVCAIAATAWLTMQLTKRAVTQEQTRTLSSDTDVYDAIIAYASGHDSWAGVNTLIRRQAELTRTRIALTTPDRNVIAASSSAAADATPNFDVPTSTVDPLVLDAGIAHGAGGQIDARAVGPYRLSETERQTLSRLAVDQVRCLQKLNINAEIIELPTGRSTVRQVDGAAKPPNACSQDDLAAAVETERAPLTQLADIAKKCVEERATSAVGAFAISPEFTVRYQAHPPPPKVDEDVRNCVEMSRREQLRPYVAPSALLFVTGLPTPEPAVNLSTTNTLRIVGTAMVILLLAFAATVIVGRRLVRPLRTLTNAARQPADRQEAVPVTTRDEIGHLAAAFNDLSDRRRALERQRKAMISDIAHELRTPLTNIRTWLETARDGAVEIDQEALDMLVEESIQLHHVVDDLHDIAAAEAGSLQVYPEPTYVKDLLEQLLEAHRGDGAVSLDLQTTDDPEVNVDPVRLRQIVGNLVSNAIRHTPTPGAVTVRLEMRPGRMVIVVSDTGAGIAPDDLPKVFDRFWRADSSRTRATGGSGLGLSIARQLARAHGGDLTATSEPGHGATFTVIMPAA
jgi:two-component system sensor histidine kinase BaeS